MRRDGIAKCERPITRCRFRLVAGVLALLVGGTLVLAQQPPADEPEPPVLLKKKKNSKSLPLPKPDAGRPPAKDDPPPAKDDARKPEPMPPEEKKAQPDEPPVEEDEAEVLARIAKNVKKSEDRLAQRDTGEGTQQVQRDILKDLDALIDRMKQPPDPMGDEGGGKSGPGGQSSARGSKGQQGKSSRSSSQQAGKSSGSQPSGAGSQSAQGNQPKGSGGSQAGHGGGEGQPNDPNKLADVFKDIWGDLPRMLRVEMDAYAREAFMLKYNDLLKQYYATIAEKGRKKGSEP